MASPRIVPSIRAFLGGATQNFVELYCQAWIKFLEKYCQGGTHDACTHQNDVRLVYGDSLWNTFCSFVSQLLRLRPDHSIGIDNWSSFPAPGNTRHPVNPT